MQGWSSAHQMKVSVFLLLQWIPCIMHMENRVGIKILTMLLSEGLAHAKGGTQPSYQQASVKAREHAFCASVNSIINNTILGSGFNKWQFSVPIEVSKTLGVGNIIGTISIENTKVRELVDNIDLLLTVCLPPEEVERIDKWRVAIRNYSQAMCILRKKESNYTEGELTSFQRNMDIFGNLWIELHQQQGMTNYIHIGVSGHLLEFMHEWGNLYRFSQQGWESLNSLIKRFFFLRTNKGGGRAKKRSRLVPIARLFQRRILWLSGLAEKHLLSMGDNAMSTTTDSNENSDEEEDVNEFSFTDI